MKITKQSFQAFFTRTSFAGLLLITGAAGARAQSTTTEEREALRDFSFEHVFSMPVGSGGSVFGVRSGWLSPETLSPGAGARSDRRASTDKVEPDWTAGPAAPASVGPLPAATVTTSGTLSAQLTATTNWSAAPWNITAGDGTYPDLGGVATFLPAINSVVGTLATTQTLALNVSTTLSGITYNTPFSTTLGAGTGGIVAATSGLTLNVLNSPINTVMSFSFTYNSLQAAISGGGTAGVTMTGSGTRTLPGTNTYTGGTHLNGGTLFVGGTAGDATLGATGAGNDISMNGGTLFMNLSGGLTTARNISLGANGGTLSQNTALTVNGVISGSGPLTINANQASGVLTLTNRNTYTGATVLGSTIFGGAVSPSALTLSGNGSIAASSSLDLTGKLTLDNSGTTGIDRLGDTAPITSRGVFLTTTGNASTASVENAGALTLASGVTTLNVTPGTAGSSLNFASLATQNGATLFVRGTNLGATPGPGNSTLTVGTGPTLVGGGGAAGSTMISIVPGAAGNLTASTTGSNTVANSVGSSFVTYNPTNGFRPLATTEYATALGNNATDNVRLTAATVAPATSTANAVLFAPAAAATLSGGTINVTSGAFLYSPTAGTGGGTVSAGLNFGAAQGVVMATNPVTISGAISGSGGLTVASPTSSAITISGANTYTGTTTLVGGTVANSSAIVMFTGAVANDGVTAGPFGLDTSAIVLNGGTGSVLLAPTATTTFNRNLLVTSSGGGASAAFGTYLTGVGLTMNGNIDLEGDLQMYGSDAPLVVNGNISGPGTLLGAGLTTTLNGNNTFTGGVITAGNTYVAGSDTAFGTGTITIANSTSTIQGSGTAARNIANNFVVVAPLTFGGTAPLNLTGSFNLDGSHTINVSNTATTTITGNVTNGALTKGGVGEIAFNSPTGNTFTGGFLNSGISTTSSAIYANNTSGSAFGSGTVSVGGTSATVYSTLAGNFTTSGTVSLGGRLSPGNGTGLTAATAGIGSIGTVNFTTLVLSSATTSSLYLEAAGSSNNDQINVSGALTLNGTIYVATTGGYTIQLGDTFTFVNAGSITQGTFTFNTSNATFAPGVGLSETVTGTQVIATAIAVPEPGTWAAVVGGLGILGGLQFARRRNRRAE